MEKFLELKVFFLYVLCMFSAIPESSVNLTQNEIIFLLCMVQGKHNNLRFLETETGGLKALPFPLCGEFTALPETSLAKDNVFRQ